MEMIRKPNDTIEIVRLGGGFIAGSCILMGALVLFVMPAGCSFVAGVLLFILSFALIAGLVLFLIGQFMVRRRRLFRSR